MSTAFEAIRRTKVATQLQLRGVGKELWKAVGGGDAYIARERAAWDDPAGEPEVKPARRLRKRR